jgi:hypothetical protein
MAAKAREEQEALTARIAVLEAKLAAMARPATSAPSINKSSPTNSLGRGTVRKQKPPVTPTS